MGDFNAELGDNLLCVTCGYDLRELPRDGECPECGLAISRSENSEQLARADPKWLALVSRGLSVYIAGQIGIVIAFLIFIGSFLFAFAFSTVTPAAGSRSWMDVLLIGSVVTAVVCLLVMGFGSYLLASPDPGRQEERKERCIRLLARFTMPGIIFYAAIMSALDLLPPTAFRSMMITFSIRFEVVWGGFAVVMVMLYVARLIERIPMIPLQLSMNKATWFLLWATPVYGVMSWIQQVWSPAGVGGNLGVSALFLGLSCASWLLGIYLIGTFIHQGLRMIRCRRAIRSCRDIAMQLNENLAADDKISNDAH